MTPNDITSLINEARAAGHKVRDGAALGIWTPRHTIILNRNWHGPKNDEPGPGAYIRDLDEYTDDAARVRELINA